MGSAFAALYAAVVLQRAVEKRKSEFTMSFPFRWTIVCCLTLFVLNHLSSPGRADSPTSAPNEPNSAIELWSKGDKDAAVERMTKNL